MFSVHPSKSEVVHLQLDVDWIIDFPLQGIILSKLNEIVTKILDRAVIRIFLFLAFIFKNEVHSLSVDIPLKLFCQVGHAKRTAGNNERKYLSKPKQPSASAKSTQRLFIWLLM